ncbi:Archaellum biogenesis protein FlaJ, TadC family [Halogranum gelatinilyticum]|uniref:Archaellum biogenesis protein FlaJ, TadC family n=1 Tax=Halogranum gelatinilyticum TaxID=660521 RepID=A0A1G9Q9J8_9EURY|nr:type II secretion system F family protein [Halogranum gelatinilyticum]SDM07639.1 Archaellum biogenesis protein FlaJ, TadC family [Halogranum gelatinilyticum]
MSLGNSSTTASTSDAADTADSADSTAGAGSLSVPDRALYALFARHADADGHAADRRQYRGTDLRVSFDVYLARVYGASWLAFAALLVPTFLVAVAVPASTLAAVADFLETGIPVVSQVGVPAMPRSYAAVGLALAVATAGKWAVVRLGGLHLRWLASARRTDIERTLPGAVRYLHALSSGSESQREMLRKVADSDAYGETAVSVRKALNTAALTGSVGEGLRRVARDTPSRDMLAPFLLKFREHANQGSDELANYLRMESRMLGHRQARARERAEGFLELLAELFIVLLVMPSLLVIVLTVMSVLAPGLSAPIVTPLGSLSVRAAIVYGSAVFVLVVGVGASVLVADLRPADQSTSYRRPAGLVETLRTATTNPASAAVVLAVPAVIAAAALWTLDYHPVDVILLSYVAYGLPVGVVAVHRARLDDAKDREIEDFVHAVSGHVSLGRPFPEAVELVARDVDLGALNADVTDLAFNLTLTTREGLGGAMADADDGTDDDGMGDDGDTDLRSAALDRFVDRVGTPLAEQSMGLVTGALDAGSDTEAVFETLQAEIARLYHEKQALRSSLLVYVAVGWTTALLVVGITVAVNGYVLDGFAQLSSLSGGSGFAFDPTAIDPARDRFRFYVVTQATMLASGWFAGMASRGKYEALLHSSALVTVCYVVFTGAGMV